MCEIIAGPYTETDSRYISATLNIPSATTTKATSATTTPTGTQATSAPVSAASSAPAASTTAPGSGAVHHVAGFIMVAPMLMAAAAIL